MPPPAAMVLPLDGVGPWCAQKNHHIGDFGCVNQIANAVARSRCQGPRNCFADALATAGNEGSFAFELKVHRSESSRCLVVRVVGVKF